MSILVLFLILLTSLSCSKSVTEWKGTIEEIDGVLVVKNPKEPIYIKEVFSIQEELRIGTQEGEEEYMFNQVRGVDVDTEGNIYVLDSQSVKVSVFDGNGRFLRTFGRQGQGPGEMQMPIFIQITSDEEIVIFDPSTRRLIFSSQDGDYLRQVSTARIGNPMHPVRLDSNGNLFAQVIPPPPMGGFELKEFDSDLELLRMIYKVKRNDSYLRDEFKVMPPGLCCAASSKDTVVWGFADKYELNVIDSNGSMIKKIKKDSKPLKVTDEDLEDLKEKFSRTSVSRLGRKPLFPDHFPAFSDISIDEKGRIFVQTYERAEKNSRFYIFDVFDSEGRYMARGPLRARSTVGFIWENDKLYTVDTDDEGYYLVKRYKVVWEIGE